MVFEAVECTFRSEYSVDFVQRGRDRYPVSTLPLSSWLLSEGMKEEFCVSFFFFFEGVGFVCIRVSSIFYLPPLT